MEPSSRISRGPRLSKQPGVLQGHPRLLRQFEDHSFLAILQIVLNESLNHISKSSGSKRPGQGGRGKKLLEATPSKY
jgi:hypothetical protein